MLMDLKILQNMQVDRIVFQFQLLNSQVNTFQFDSKILQYNIQYLANNHNQPYPIPKNIIKSIKPFEIMKQFVIAHNYSSSTIKINKPLNSSNYAEVVDPITFSIFSKYCDQGNADEASEIIKFGEYIRFHELSDAVTAAVGTNFFIGEDEKSLDDFIKKNALEGIGSEQISEIIKLYEDQFKMIEYKAKRQILKIAQGDPIQQPQYV